MYFHTSDWDLALFGWINQTWQNPVFDFLMPLISSAIFLWILAAGLAAFAVRKKAVPASVILGLALCIGASDMTCSLIKASAGRVRPYQSIAGARYLDSGAWKTLPQGFTPVKNSGSSFPSAHASNAAAAVMVVFAVLRRKSLWLIPLCIGYSRIYLGKHFPTDVMAGWITGLAVAAVLVPLYPSIWNGLRSRWTRYRPRT